MSRSGYPIPILRCGRRLVPHHCWAPSTAILELPERGDVQVFLQAGMQGGLHLDPDIQEGH